MTTKAHPERVDPELARRAVGQATQRTHCYTQYIMLHYRATGNLAPGCDARDLYAWLEQNEPERLAAITARGRQYWQTLEAKLASNPEWIRVGGESYQPDKADGGDVPYDDEWRVRYHDGRLCRYARLWHHGKMPAWLAERRPDNAVFEKGPPSEQK